MPREISIIHLSDLHFSDAELGIPAMMREFGPLSKRVLGQINAQWLRGRHFSVEWCRRLLEHLKTEDWDYLIISGDVTTLGLKSEFVQARLALEPLIDRGPVIIIPGNHDRYAPDVVLPDVMADIFPDCFPFNGEGESVGAFRAMAVGEASVLLTIDMARPRFLFSSRGVIERTLTQEGKRVVDRFPESMKIMVGHYPAFLPPGIYEHYFHSLAGKRRLQEFLIQNRIDYYLHGHIHKTWQMRPAGRSYPICLNSGGCCRFSLGPWSGFHRLRLSGQSTIVERIVPTPTGDFVIQPDAN